MADSTRTTFCACGFYAASAHTEIGRAPLFAPAKRAHARFCSETRRSGLDNGENLSLRDHVVQFDVERFEFAGSGRRNRDFHLHGFDKCDVVAVADAPANVNRQRANAPRHLSHDLDFWHSTLRHSATRLVYGIRAS